MMRRTASLLLLAASAAGRAGVRQLEREMVSLLGGEEPDPSELYTDVLVETY